MLKFLAYLTMLYSNLGPWEKELLGSSNISDPQTLGGSDIKTSEPLQLGGSENMVSPPQVIGSIKASEPQVIGSIKASEPQALGSSNIKVSRPRAFDSSDIKATGPQPLPTGATNGPASGLPDAGAIPNIIEPTPPAEHRVGDHFWGTKSPSDRLLHSALVYGIKKPSEKNFVKFVFRTKGVHPATISYVTVFWGRHNGKETTVTLKEGGVGHNNIIIHFEAPQNQDLHYYVNIYGH